MAKTFAGALGLARLYKNKAKAAQKREGKALLSSAVLWQYLWAHKYTFGLGIVMIIATNWIFVSIPLYFKRAIDLINLSRAEQNPQLWVTLGQAAMLGVVAIATRTYSRTLFFNPGREIEYEIKINLFAKLAKLSPFYFERHAVGSILSKLNNDITYVRLLCGFGTLQLVNLVFVFSLAPFRMWEISPLLTFYCLIPLVLGFAVVRIGLTYILKMMQKRSKDLQHLTAYSVSSLNGLDTIRNYSVELTTQNQFDHYNQELLKSTLGLTKWRMVTAPLLANLEELTKIVIVIFTAYIGIKGGFTLGDMTAFLTYLAMLTPPLASIGWLTNVLKQGLVSLDNLVEIFSQPEREELAGAKDNHGISEALDIELEKGITFENVSFTYPGADYKSLDSLSFSIGMNEVIGVLGSVGSGKSTLAMVLGKYYTQHTPHATIPGQEKSGGERTPVAGQMTMLQGKILVGGLDLEDIPEMVWREKVCVIPQDAYLFSDTILENIYLGLEEPMRVDKDWKLAVRRSALDGEVKNFPNQEQQMIGEKGIMLSGGQKQRLSIARGIVRSSKLLIFDNVLSAVDVETESFLIKEIQKEKLASAMVIISHRVKVLEKANKILVLEQGKLVEQGTHKELLAHNGIYAHTWRIQNL